MDPTPVAVVIDAGFSAWSLEEWAKFLALIAGFITITVVPAIVVIINTLNKQTTEIKRGNDENQGANIVKVAQFELANEGRGVGPVTMQTLPGMAMGTGDGGVRTAVVDLLAATPTAAVVPAASTGPSNEDLMRVLMDLMAQRSAREPVAKPEDLR